MNEEKRIFRFITHQMTKEELSAFELEMETNLKLCQSIEHSRRIRNMVSSDVLKFSLKVKEIINSKKKESAKIILKYWVAATVLLLNTLILNLI